MSRYENIEQRLADWLEKGPIGAPDPPIVAALAHARAHPRRQWSAIGHWRTLMSGTNTVHVGPQAPKAGWLYAAAAVLVIVVVVAGGYGILQSTNPGTGVGGPPSVVPTATASPAATATPSPTPVRFNGWESCTQVQEATVVQVGDVKESRGDEHTCTASNSDPRLAGRGTATMNWDDYPDGTEIVWGTRVITNDGGTWRSVWSATTTTSATTMSFPTVFIGEGGYAGLVAAVDVVVGASSVTGVIMPAPPTITGHAACSFNDASDEFKIGDITAYRRVVGTCTVTMSDPRVTGTGHNDVSIDMRPDESADIRGRYVLSNDGGTWEGLEAGTVDAGYTTHRIDSLLVGTGEYAGLLFRTSIVTDATDTGYDVTGLIVPRP